MVKNDIIKIVKKISRKNINPNKNIFQQGIDSIDFTTIILTIEEKYKMKFKSNSYDKLSSINDIVKYINNIKK
jgi:acyl carrier protein